MFTLAELEEAARLVHAAFPPTPQYAWPLLAQRIGTEVWVKHENHTPTGAFKIRGGLVFMERLKRENPDEAGVVSATRGNHGQSLAYAGARYGIPVTILVPRGNSAEKNAAMRAQGIAVATPPSPGASDLSNLQALWANAGLQHIETQAITVQRTFASFDDYWATVLGGPSVGKQLAALDAAANTGVSGGW